MKIKRDLSLRSQIRDFVDFAKNLIDDDSIALIFQCSKSTVIRAKNEDLSKKMVTMGAPTILDKNETDEILDWIKKRTNKLNPPTRCELSQKVQDILQEKGKKHNISKNWVDGFIQQNSEFINKDKACPIEDKRGNVTKQEIQQWFSLLRENKVNECDPSLILNLDEIGFGISDVTNIKYKKVIVPSNIKKTIFFSMRRETNHVSMINCICANGELLKPGIIGSNKNLSADSEKTTHYGNILYYQSKSAFICADIYVDYLQKVVFPYINERRAEINKPDLRAIIIADGHKSHVSELAKALCASNNIEYLVIPPHSSHVLQPLDLCFFSLVKSNYRNLKEDFGFSSFTNKIERIFVSVQKAQVTSFILHSWKKAGIDPILLNGEVNQVILRPEIVENGFFFRNGTNRTN